MKEGVKSVELLLNPLTPQVSSQITLCPVKNDCKNHAVPVYQPFLNKVKNESTSTITW